MKRVSEAPLTDYARLVRRRLLGVAVDAGTEPALRFNVLRFLTRYGGFLSPLRSGLRLSPALLGPPDLLRRPLPRPLGADVLVIGMVDRILRRVQLSKVEHVETRPAQDLKQLRVADVELGACSDLVVGPVQSVHPIQRPDQLLPIRSVSEEHTISRSVDRMKTSSPPGRSRRAASGIQRSGSHHSDAPYSEKAMSNDSSGRGTASALAMRNSSPRPNFSFISRAVSSCAGVISTPSTRFAPCFLSHAPK